MRNHQFRAFTLIEIMIVIAIIAILAGVIVPRYRQLRADAKYEACKQIQLKIAAAVDMYRMRHPKFMRDPSKKTTYYITDDCELVQEGYLQKTPRCPDDGSYFNLNPYDMWGGPKNNPLVNFYYVNHTRDAHFDKPCVPRYVEFAGFCHIEVNGQISRIWDSNCTYVRDK